MKFRRSLSIVFLVLCVVAITATVAAQAKRPAKKAYLDANTINYIRPGVKIKVVSAAIASDGTITARVPLATPIGGAVRLYIPINRLCLFPGIRPTR